MSISLLSALFGQVDEFFELGVEGEECQSVSFVKSCCNGVFQGGLERTIKYNKREQCVRGQRAFLLRAKSAKHATGQPKPLRLLYSGCSPCWPSVLFCTVLSPSFLFLTLTWECEEQKSGESRKRSRTCEVNAVGIRGAENGKCFFWSAHGLSQNRSCYQIL